MQSAGGRFATVMLKWLEADEIGDVLVVFLFSSREARLRNFC